MTRRVSVGIVCGVIFSGLIPAAADGPAGPQQGKPFSVPFPDFPPTLHELATKKPTKTQMTIFLPQNYSRQRKHPLLIFLGGGDGGAGWGATVARKLTEEQDFVCLDLPLFREKADPPPVMAIRDNDFAFMWPLFKKMLARAEELVPNIDPKCRVIGGFSNGGHTTAGMIDTVGEEFASYFTAFVFVEGGFKLQHVERIKGKPLLILYGGARDRDWDALVGMPAREAGVKVTLHKMEGIGHAFPEIQYLVVREWLRELER